MWSHLGNGNFYKKRLGKKKQERLNLCQSNVWPKWKPVPVWTKSQVWTFTLTIIGTPTLGTTLLLQYIGDLRKEIRELPNEFHFNIRWLWFWLRCEKGVRGRGTEVQNFKWLQIIYTCFIALEDRERWRKAN